MSQSVIYRGCQGTRSTLFLFAVVVLALAAWLPESVEAQEDPALKASPTVYGPGERMVFSIGYGPITAGEGILEVVGLTEYQGHTCYHIQSKANSNRFFSSIYKVRDKVTSYIDIETLYSRYFNKRLREGDYKKTVEIDFDHLAEEARYADGRTFPIATGVQDVLSAFYYVRNLDLAPGKIFDVPAHSSRRTYDLKVIIHRKEMVEVEAGTWNCFVVEPVLEGEGLFKHEGKMTLYITDDAHRIPVLIKTKVPVGSIDVELKEYQAGVPLRPLSE